MDTLYHKPQAHNQLPSEQEKVNCDIPAGTAHAESYESRKNFLNNSWYLGHPN